MTTLRFVFGLVAMLFAGTVMAQTPAPRPPATLTAQGNGTIMVAPDVMTLDVAVTTRGADLADVSQRHTQAAAKALDALHAMLKADDKLSIESSGFELSRETPVPADAAHKNAEPTYVAKTVFHLKSGIVAGANDLVGRLAATGMFEIGATAYGLADESAVRDKARRAAVADAREKAAIYSEAADVKLLDVASINDEEQPILPRFTRAAVPGAAPLSITPPAQIAVTARVGMVWHIGPR